MGASDRPSAWRFGEFVLRPAQRTLSRTDGPVPLGGRAFDLLCALVENRDRVVGKEELLALTWPGSVVEENNLSVQVSTLRRALGPETITTVPGRGYRWTAETVLSDVPAPEVRSGLPQPPSLAVMPFALAGADPDGEYFADGLVEDIVASLSRSRWLRVLAHASTQGLRGVEASPKDLCKALGVQYLVRGTVRQSGGRLRVSTALIDGRDGETVWAEHHDRDREALFELQDAIAARIAATVEPAFLRHEEVQASRRQEQDLAHWELLMRARWHYWRSSRRHLDACRRLLVTALARRPDDVATLTLLAFALSTEAWSGWSADPKDAAQQATRLALRAVALDDTDAFAHFTLGVTLVGFGQIERAMAEHRRALELHPHFAAARAELGRLLAYAGQAAEAELLIRRAMADSPVEPRMALWVFSLGIASFVDGRFAEGAQHATAAIAQRPDWFFSHYLRAVCLSLIGDDDSARQALTEGQRLLPGFSAQTLPLGHPFQRDEDRQRYIQALRRLGWNG